MKSYSKFIVLTLLILAFGAHAPAFALPQDRIEFFETAPSIVQQARSSTAYFAQRARERFKIILRHLGMCWYEPIAKPLPPQPEPAPEITAQPAETLLEKANRRVAVIMGHIWSSSTPKTAAAEKVALAPVNGQDLKSKLLNAEFSYETEHLILKKNYSDYRILLLDKRTLSEVGMIGLSIKGNSELYVAWLRIYEAYQGHSYPAEAAKKLLEIAFDDLGVLSVHARISCANINSQRATSKAGLKNYGERWSITKEEWLAQQKTKN